ncbi:hypothetical protein B0H17DRAFT_936713 [Mycena rosella]|uniref:BTB domain-containing protein n=1 Tax=Mycena rosella TaxID=1033263 RepID=A0AAD7GDV0_MYCRO|nr:hypothetical protein B0H17DRAFT_936713 [Mycena rosella]
MEVDSRPREPLRVEQLWFEDGNLVLQAGNCQFRLHRGILAARSPVQDMLSFPQPPESELVEGCPLVRLPDAETEVRYFLKAIFIPEYFPAFPAPTNFSIIVGCLRLGHKYEVDYLRRRALIHLSSQYRTTLSEHDSRIYAGSPNIPPSRVMSWLFPTTPTFTISVIQLAREVGVLWVLPFAFYDLSTSFNMPLDSHGGTIGREIFHGAFYNGVSTSLCVQDQDSFLTGHVNHTRAAVDITRFLLDPPEIHGCTSRTHCLGVRVKAVNAASSMLQRYCNAPLDIWEEDDWSHLHDLCPICLAALKRIHAEARETLWGELPTMYGLPPWEELEKMKVAAIGNSM